MAERGREGAEIVVLQMSCTERQTAYEVRGTASVQKPDDPGLQEFPVSPEIGYRLAALCDGEGHFAIRKAETAYKCLFVVGLRADDAEFLHRMRDAVGLGSVTTFPAYPTTGGRKRSPAAHWRIAAKRECLAFVWILDAYTLWSKKARDYAIWREAVLQWQEIEHHGRVRRDWTRLAALSTELHDLRRAA